jgi:hypothetical protein
MILAFLIDTIYWMVGSNKIEWSNERKMAIKYHALIVNPWNVVLYDFRNMLRRSFGANTDSWVANGRNSAKISNCFIICFSEK